MPYINAVIFLVLGALVGVFLNKLIYRLPKGIPVFTPSRCMHEGCQQVLSAGEQVPVFSYLLQQGKCKHCGKRIAPRNLWVEWTTALVFGTIAYVYPVTSYPVLTLMLCLIAAVLVVFSAIDLETHTIEFKTVLMLMPLGLLTALVASSLYPQLRFPTVLEALQGMLLGAGVFVVVNNYGAWVMRGFREPRYPEYPIGFMTVNVALVAGILLGWLWGIGVALLVVALNLVFRRVVRIPDFLTLTAGLVLVYLVFQGNFGLQFPADLWNGVMAAGGAVLLQGLYWSTQKLIDDDRYDPIAVGFGDVMLAGLAGAFLGPSWLWIGIIVLGLTGILFGAYARVAWMEKKLPMAPFLSLGIVVTLLLLPFSWLPRF